MRAVVLLAGALAASSLCACSHRREKSLVLLHDGDLAPLAVISSGVRNAHERSAGTSNRVRNAHEDGWSFAAPRAASAGGTDGDAVLVSAPVVRTSSAPRAHQPLPPGVDVAQASRETFLSCECEIVAEKATLYVPTRYAAEVLLDDGGRTLRLRRLTIRARVLKFVPRTDSDDVSITARGNVSFRADRPASVISESGLRALLIRNDRHTPLR